ncbi:hypothetical protein [Aeromonas enteropelogenes]|uniref:hypothetical protein n=1 Tax=Aeromonas enteropelogenes TaxID=29489 RepID=UPI003BA09F20
MATIILNMLFLLATEVALLAQADLREIKRVAGFGAGWLRNYLRGRWLIRP